MSSPAPSQRHLVDRLADRVRVSETPGLPAPWLKRLDRPLLLVLRLLFRPRLVGWEHLPDEPFLAVSNHSGVGVAECFALAALWRERFGDSRSIAGMAAPPVFLIPGAGYMLRSAGAVPSTYRHAEAAAASGASLIVFPGGDFDAFRPIWQANKVDFNRRKGYLRLARKLGVPIVPIGIHGSHYTAPILWRSELIPKLFLFRHWLGVKRWPVTLLAVVGAALILGLGGPVVGYGPAAALALVFFMSPIGALPIVPWTITIRLGPALHPQDLFTKADEDLDEPYDRVVGEVQRLVLERG